MKRKRNQPDDVIQKDERLFIRQGKRWYIYDEEEGLFKRA